LEDFLLLIGLTFTLIWVAFVISTRAYQTWADYVLECEFRRAQPTVSQFVDKERKLVTAIIKHWCGLATESSPASGPVAAPSQPGPDRDRQQSRVSSDGLVGRLTIPRLQLRAIVHEGTGEGTLTLGLGHITGTAFPGQDGNVGVAGHRDTQFRALRTIRKGDLIQFQTLAANYSYRVEKTRVVDPENVSVLSAGPYPELTLVTCYPFYYVGYAPQRFIVKARQVTPAALDDTRPATMESKGVEAKAAHPERGQNSSRGQPHDRTVAFQVSEKHSRELVPGISLGLSRTDPVRHRVDGWMWVVSERRTIWLKNQETRKPVVFYGHKDGKKRELVITNVTRKSAGGYLILPKDL
jgi:sortase A